MGRKRRGSQAFSFEQSEETLMQNETIVKLYQNKTFLPPEQKEFETINEEGAEKTAQRAKRGQNVSLDGTLVLGNGKALRKILEYKFWKQDDKERNRKRKLMITRQWKGRKKGKIVPLEFSEEQKLIDLIADRVPTDDEDEEDEDGEERTSPKKMKFLDKEEVHQPRSCVWNAPDSKSSRLQHQKQSTSSSDIDFGQTCVWKDPTRDFEDESSVDEVSTNEKETPSYNDKTESSSNLTNSNMEISSNEKESYSHELHELQGLIPESELAELLQTDDLLFCNDDKPRPDPVKVLGSIENVPHNIENKKDSRKSLRRSARIMSIPNVTGSIFTGSNSNDVVKDKVNDDSKRKVVPRLKKTRKCTQRLDSIENKENDKRKASDELDEETTSMKVVVESVDKVDPIDTDAKISSKRKRRSYSLEDGLGRFSLDGSRKNSLLTVTGDMEINISMPDAVRRSMSTDKISFSGVSPAVTSASANKKQSSLGEPVKEKICLPVPGFLSSDSEEEEVIISGMLKKKTLKTKVKSRH